MEKFLVSVGKRMRRGWSDLGIAGAAMIILITTGVGCGSTTKVTSETNSSVGQQLIELEQAHSRGIIDEKEYAKLRKAIVQKND